MLTRNSTFSAAAPPPFSAGGRFQAPCSPAGICSGSKPSSQNISDCVFGSAPSRPEVERAILDLQRLKNSYSLSLNFIRFFFPQLFVSKGKIGLSCLLVTFFIYSTIQCSIIMYKICKLFNLIANGLNLI